MVEDSQTALQLPTKCSAADTDKFLFISNAANGGNVALITVANVRATVRGYTGSVGVGYTGSLGYVGSGGYTGSIGVGYTGSIGTQGYAGSVSSPVGFTGSVTTGSQIILITDGLI